VVNGDELARHPEQTLRRLCDHLQLEFLPESLNWEPACPEQWRAWRSWHRDAECSTRIFAPDDEFDERLLTEQPRLMTYYQAHRPFYERMNQFVQQGHA
jgi:hypothetical protein